MGTLAEELAKFLNNNPLQEPEKAPKPEKKRRIVKPAKRDENQSSD